METGFRNWLHNEKAVTKRLKVATVAMQCHREPAANRSEIADQVEAIVEAHPDVELIVFGEMTLGWYNPGGEPDYHRRISEPIPGETTRLLGELARKHGIALCFGLSEIDNGTLYNAQVLLNPQGEIQAVHRKWNLKAGERKAGYQPGGSCVTVTTIKGIRTGLIICSDAAHPRTIKELIKHRLDLILFSLADDRDEKWFVAKANARLYDAWVVSANRYGQEDHYWNGHLVISDPLGALRCTSLDKEQTLVYALGFPSDERWLERLMRNVVVKTPLLIHALRHWKILLSYYR
ncbi:MAG: carbon-nitrogen hydrolase family protein [Anaerolineae bacterium]|nr:carbon-nitrogen hydrolase family protein [Anaerolineae bacterium]